jgi:carboxyl-terminal processing protease
MEEAATLYNSFLSKPFDFTVDEEVELDGDKLNYASTESEIKRSLEKKNEIPGFGALYGSAGVA